MHKKLEAAVLNLGIKVDLNVISSKVKNLFQGKYIIHILDQGTVYLYLQNTAPSVNCYNRVKFKTFNNELTTILSNVLEYDFSSTTVNYDGIEIELYYKSSMLTCHLEYKQCPSPMVPHAPPCCSGLYCAKGTNDWWSQCQYHPTPEPIYHPTPAPPTPPPEPTRHPTPAPPTPPTPEPTCHTADKECPSPYPHKPQPCCAGYYCEQHNKYWSQCKQNPTPAPPTPSPKPTPIPPPCIPYTSNKDTSNKSYNVSSIRDVTGPFLNGNLKGVNITGFDNGGSVIDAPPNTTSPFLTDALLLQNHYAIVTIDPSFNTYIIDNSIQIARLPVMPFYIFKRSPYPFYDGSSSALSPIFDGIYGPDCSCIPTNDPTNDSKWCTGRMTCLGDGSDNWKPGCPNYLWAIKKLIKKKIYCIIDIHSNNYNLCSLSRKKTQNLPMTPEDFIAMWEHIAHYIFTKLDPEDHKYIIFELCNEPVGKGSNCESISDCSTKKQCQKQYDLRYQIPTIDAIKKLEDIYSKGVHHIIMVTTYNNWSGVHFWPADGTLHQLAIDLQSKGYDNSSKSKVIIAGHQYCDNNYSGVASDCLPGFAKDATNWVHAIDNILEPFNLLWFQTEGNIMSNTNSVLNHSDDYKKYLAKLHSSKSNIGYTLWFMNSSSLATSNSTPGALGNMNIPDNSYNYSKIYNISGIHMYNNGYNDYSLPKYNFNKLLK